MGIINNTNYSHLNYISLSNNLNGCNNYGNYPSCFVPMQQLSHSERLKIVEKKLRLYFQKKLKEMRLSTLTMETS